MGVVVETAHQSFVHLVGHAGGPQPGLDPVEVGDGVGRHRIREPRRILDRRPAGGHLCVEDPERVGVDLGGVGLVELVGHATEEVGQQLGVGHAAGGLADRVELEADLRQAQYPRVEVPEPDDDLDVDVWVGRADDLGAELVVLAEAALLRPLMAEVLAEVPDLPRRERVMLEEGAGDRGRRLGPERDLRAVAVGEDVHLLGDDVGALPDPEEHLEALEDRGADLAVTGQAEVVGERVTEGTDPGRILRQQVAHAGQRLGNHSGGHGSPMLPARDCTGECIEPRRRPGPLRDPPGRGATRGRAGVDP